MKLPPFEYAKPATLDECLSQLADADGEVVKILAGGQSLLPLMALQLAAPERIIDIGGLAELRTINITEQAAEIGALTVHRQLQSHPKLRNYVDLVGAAANHIGHLAIRNRGTIGGSLAHADRAAEMPAVMLALNAKLECRSLRGGTRQVLADKFFQGPFMTALDDDEILTKVVIPINRHYAYGFSEFSVRHGDFATAGACCAIGIDGDGRVGGIRAVLFGSFTGPTVIDDLGKEVAGSDITKVDWRELAERVYHPLADLVDCRLAQYVLEVAFIDAAKKHNLRA